MLRVAFDLDGVLADFRSAFLAEAARVLGWESIQRPASPMPDVDAVSPEDAKRVWKSITATPNWWLSLEAHEPPQIARLYALAREHRWEVSFVTSRIPTAGDSVQFQSQTWLEQQGYFLPAVVTVPGSRGEVANALRLDVVIDDQLLNCMEVIGASQAKAVLMLHSADVALERQALDRGIGVIHSVEEAVDLLIHLHRILHGKRGTVLRLADWFLRKDAEPPVLPLKPREARPLPGPDEGRR